MSLEVYKYKMKPKYSTGYLTPQSNRIRRRSTPKRSESNDDLNSMINMSDSFFEKLMSCPIKRQLIVNLLSSQKENIEEYKRKQAEEEKKNQSSGSPLRKVQRKYQCESPTALLRRRAIEQQARQSPISENQSDAGGSRSSSRQSTNSSSASPVPFDKLLDGVIAYVEVRSKDQDRSSGAKALMRSMGATVRDEFTKDVTHVVFKDGSFTTYQKAKLLKVHLVSVLWIEAVRSSNTRVPEKKFPALGTEAYNHNVSSLCSQMQKDYEDIVRDEVRRSLATGTPLPSTKSLIDRRRTIMTPLPITSKQFSQELRSTQDKEVEQIIKLGSKTSNINSSPITIKTSPELTSDEDSDLGPCIDGTIVNRKKNMPNCIEELVVINSTENLQDSNMELTYIENSESVINMDMRNRRKTKTNKLSTVDESVVETPKKDDSDSIYNKSTPKLADKKSSGTKRQSKILDNNNCFSIPDDSVYRRRTRQLKISFNALPESSTGGRKNVDRISSNKIPSQLRSRSSTLEILSKNTCANVEAQADNSSTSLSTLQLSNEKHSLLGASASTNMSSLHISSDSSKGKNNDNQIADKSTSTNMSALAISSDSNKNETSGDIQEQNNNVNGNLKNTSGSRQSSLSKIRENSATGDGSFSPLNGNLMKHILQIVDETPVSDQYVTKRRGSKSDTRRKIALPLDNGKNNILEGLNPSEKSKKSNFNEAANENSEINVGRRSLRSSTITASKNKDLNQKPRRTLGTRRKSIMPLHPSSTDRSDSPEKRKAEENLQKNSREIHSDSELTDNKTSRGRRKIVNRKGKSSNNNNSQADDQTPSNESDNNGSGKRRRLRKLYNPDDSVKDIVLSDEQERQDKRTEVKKRNSNEGVILNTNIISVAPNVLLTAKAKDFLDKNKIDIQKVLDKSLEESEEEKTSRRKGKKKKEVATVKIDGNADEQKKLAEEFVNKKKDDKSQTNSKQLAVQSEGRIMKRRQSVRLSQHPKKKLNFNSSTSSCDEKSSIPKTPVKRRSTLEFQTLSQRSAKKKLKIDKSKQPSIVCTRLHKEDIQVFYQIVKKLGGFVIEDEVSDKTTHLVAGEPKRTVNMLRAMARGCWIIKHEWLYKSLEEGKWLPEEDFEETDFSPAVQKCRLQRQAFGPSFSMDIFQDCGSIYIAKGSNPRCSDLRELVIMCKGKVVTIPRNADIVVGEFVRHEGVKCVKETWLLDCITFNKKMPLKKYIITSNTSNSLHV